MEGDLPASDRQVLLHVHSGAVHARQAVLGHLLVQHDVDSTEGELPGPEFHPGREGADEGGLPENHPYHDAGLIRAAVRPVGGVGVAADGAYRPPVEGGRPLSSDNLLRRVAVSSPRHQPEYAAGAGPLGPVPEAGDSEEDNSRRPAAAGNLPEHRLDAVGLTADRYHSLLAQLQILGETYRLLHVVSDKGHPPVLRRGRSNVRLRLRPHAA